MYCDCEHYCDYGEPMEFSTTTFPRARASWTCLECGRTIRPGERYEKIRGKFEGEFVTYRTCIGCQRLRDDLRCCGGALDEVVRECFGVGIRDAKPASPVDLG